MSEYKRITDKRLKIGCFYQPKSKEERIELVELSTQLTYEAIYARLADLENKIENGTLIELPCKVGDKVYTIEGEIIEEYEVMGILVQFEELFFKILRKRDLVCKFWGSRSVFLTRAEAEQRLKECGGEV